MKISIGIDSANPAHTRIWVFTSQKIAAGTSDEMDNTTRGFSGDLTIDTKSVKDFIKLLGVSLVKVRAMDEKGLRFIDPDWQTVFPACDLCETNIAAGDVCIRCDHKRGASHESA